MRFDLVIIAGLDDLDALFRLALKSYLRQERLFNDIFIITNAKEKVQALSVGSIQVVDDREFLSQTELKLPGWYRQQIVKLRSHSLVSTDVFCLGAADTVLLHPIAPEDLTESGIPILYFNRYNNTNVHLNYERERVRNLASHLDVEPARSIEYGDFIFDFKAFSVETFRALDSYLYDKFGQDYFLRLCKGRANSIGRKNYFGEWTLIALFILDILKAEPPIKCSPYVKFLAQLHTTKDLEEFGYDFKAVHFVDKSFDRSHIYHAVESLWVSSVAGSSIR